MKQENNNGPYYAVALVACVLIVTLGVLFSGALKGGTATTTIQQAGGNLSWVTVQASGSMVGIPSMATVSLYINATGNTTSAATANLSAKLTAFNKTVYGYVGGNMSLVSTGYYNVGKPDQYYYPYTNKTNSSVPYQAQEYITVTLPQIGKLNSFLSNITSVQGLQVQSVSATLSNAQITQLRKQALQAAVANATSQAVSIIGNRTILNTTVTIEGYNSYPYPLYASANGGASLAPNSRLYYNGTSSVTESIEAAFFYRN
jgi:uncharacterized protein YggE